MLHLKVNNFGLKCHMERWEKEQLNRGSRERKNILRMERQLDLSFTLCDIPTPKAPPHSLPQDPLIVARLFLFHCEECWLHTQEVGSWVSSPLPIVVECSLKRNVSGAVLRGRGYTHAHMHTELFASNQEGTPDDL